jgi:hypothetical protein
MTAVATPDRARRRWPEGLSAWHSFGRSVGNRGRRLGSPAASGSRATKQNAHLEVGVAFCGVSQRTAEKSNKPWPISGRYPPVQAHLCGSLAEHRSGARHQGRVLRPGGVRQRHDVDGRLRRHGRELAGGLQRSSLARRGSAAMTPEAVRALPGEPRFFWMSRNQRRRRRLGRLPLATTPQRAAAVLSPCRCLPR